MERRLQNSIDMPHGFYRVAESDGETVGVLLASVTLNNLFVSHLALAIHYRRQAVGTALMRASIREARRLKMKRVSLHSLIAAAPFNAQIGFRGSAISIDLAKNA